MNTGSPSDGNIKSGTIGGTLLVLLMQLTSGEVVKTALLAAVGAAVSFAVSVLLKWLVRKVNKR
jgi:mannitol-specific phosphotransferase system IIBC component